MDCHEHSNDFSILIASDKEEVISRLSEVLKTTSEESISRHGVYNVGLSGASSVTLVSKVLPTLKVDLGKWKFFFCDERVVPADSADSTFGAYKKQVIDLGLNGLTADNFVQIKQGVSAEEAAKDYAEKIRQLVPCNPIPQFDMLLMGMGPDGHTASLFPGHPLLKENEKWVAAITDSPKPPPQRITLTFPVINNAKYCVFVVVGREKADMVKKVLKDKEDLPSGKVRTSQGKTLWILDSEAGMYVQET